MILQVARQFMVDKSEGWEIEDKLVCVATYQSRLIMRLNGKREFLDIWVRNDGSTTLGYSGGSRENLEFRKELCKYIAEQCSLPAEVSKKDPWQTFYGIKESDARTIVGLVKESEHVAQILKDNESTTPEHIFWQFKDYQSNKLTIHLYLNSRKQNTLLIQGRYTILFSETVWTILHLLDIDIQDTSVSLKQSEQSVSLDREYLEMQFREQFPFAYDNISESKFRNCVLQALWFMFSSFEYIDYTALTYNAYRSLEAHLKQVLYNLGIISVNQNNSSFNMFNGTNYQLNPSSKEIIRENNLDKADAIVDYLSGVYQIIKEERHIYFHWEMPNETGIEETRTIETKEEATEKIGKCLTKIDEYYRIIS